VSGHTPGPWTLSSTYPLHVTAAGGEYIVSPGGIMPSGKANARLIAAAPDLLTAVLLAADYFERLPQFPDRGVDIKAVTLALRAAIAKAEA